MKRKLDAKWADQRATKKRRMDSPDHSLDNPAADIDALPPAGNQADTKILSPIEHLPSELLEDILAQSTNPALPLCSRTLLARLSHDRVKMAFCTHIMYTTDRHRTSASGPVAAAQTTLLSRRFFTWGFFRAYAAAALRRHRDDIRGPWQAWTRDIRAFFAQISADACATPGREWPFDLPAVLRGVARGVRANYAPAECAPFPPYLTFCKSARIPAKLFRCPWRKGRVGRGGGGGGGGGDDSALHLLKYLIAQHLGRSWDAGHEQRRREADCLRQGILGAARQGEWEALATLCQLPHSRNVAAEAWRVAVTEGGGDARWDAAAFDALQASVRPEHSLWLDPVVCGWARAHDGPKARFWRGQIDFYRDCPYQVVGGCCPPGWDLSEARPYDVVEAHY